MKKEIKRGPSFKPEMIRAILNTKPDTWPPQPIDEGKPFKWQTRRVVKPQPNPHGQAGYLVWQGQCWYDGQELSPTEPDQPDVSEFAPYQPGQTYYVCEPVFNFDDSSGPVTAYSATSTNVIGHIAEDDDGELIPWQKGNGRAYKKDKLPGIFMPERAARIFIEIKNVRVERVQDINTKDALAEGVSGGYVPGGLIYSPPWNLDAEYGNGNRAFQHMWEDIHGEESWQSNPWVWVYEIMRKEVRDG